MRERCATRCAKRWSAGPSGSSASVECSPRRCGSSLASATPWRRSGIASASRNRGATESETPEWRKQAFEFSPAGDKYFVLIPGASHLSFTGGTGALAFEPVQTSPSGYGQRGNYPQQQNPQRPAGFANRGPFNTIKITSLSFWDAYLKNAAAARELLTPEKF